MPPPDPQAGRAPTCDLVMKGGITSGVVYPKAVVELSKKYRFRGIGGASAGAIAAAGTAAAELGRDTGGFDKLADLCDHLAERGNLRALFQPTPVTRPVMDFGMAWLTKPAGRSVRRFLFQYFVARPAAGVFLALLGLCALVLVLAAAAGLGPAEVLTWRQWAVVSAGVSFLGAVALVPFVVLRRVDGWLRVVTANHLGVCTGMPGAAAPGAEALTPFLADRFADLAGLPPGEVLTFGHFRRGRPPADWIELRLMTSNLSLQRPYVFPLRDDRFLFRADELAAFFPEEVVAHLIAHPPRAKELYPLAAGSGLHYLPDADDLPVILPVRISLSFPVLFAAVPLYTVTHDFVRRHKADPAAVVTAEPRDVQRNYFADGGIVSNFPIHMFDRWLPDGPTFGINLADVETEETARQDAAHRAGRRKAAAGGAVAAAGLAAPSPQATAAAPAAPDNGRVVLPAANEAVVAEWQNVASLGDLAGAVLYTAKNHRDRSQAELPSYKERVVTVRLLPHEGGFNLDMDPTVISGVADLGTAAGAVLLSEFREDHHRWVRLRVVLARLEQELRGLREKFRTDPWYAALLARPLTNPKADFPEPGFPFHWTEAEWAAVRPALEELWRAVDGQFPGASGPLDLTPPSPLPVKRMVPAEGGDQYTG